MVACRNVLGNLDVAQDGTVPSLRLRIAFLDPIDAHSPQLPVVAQFRIVKQLLTGMSHCERSQCVERCFRRLNPKRQRGKQQQVAIRIGHYSFDRGTPNDVCLVECGAAATFRSVAKPDIGRDTLTSEAALTTLVRARMSALLPSAERPR